jgi:hydroxymethylbilane synthase
LQQALLEGRIDLAVHSTKDVPTLSPLGLEIAAFPQREDPRDVLVSRHGTGIAELPRSPRIGTSSRRRAVQIAALRPDAVVVDLRGNIDTRLRKAASSEYDAVILAAAGLLRMEWTERISQYLPIDAFTPSPGQGALAIETRTSPDPVPAMVGGLNHTRTATEVSLERRFLMSIGGGCTTPIGAHARVETAHGREVVRFWGMLANEDGTRLERVYEEFPPEQGDDVVWEIAQQMMQSLAPVWEGASIDDVPARDLEDRRVLTTGTLPLAESLRRAFERRGAVVIHQPTITVAPPDAPEVLDTAIVAARSGAYDWVIATSENAVDAVARAAGGEHAPRVATVGEQTARRLRQRGVASDLVPAGDQRAAGLLTAMNDVDLYGARVLCLLGNRARTELADGLRARGARVDVVEAYRTVDLAEPDANALASIRAGEVDVVTFGSPSSVHSLVRLLGVDLAALSGACLAAIGPTTATAMDAAGLTAHVVALTPDADGIADAVSAYLSGKPQVVKGGVN